MAGDDTGDNLSSENGQYCELTAQYWAWKNDRTANVKGLAHYRRYFMDKALCPLNEEQILELLDQYDAILAYPVYKTKINEVLYRHHPERSSDMLKRLRKVLSENWPEYLQAFDYYAYRYKQSFSNMIIAGTDCFDRYSEWLFDVLAKYRDAAGELPPRQLGFVAEYLTNTWMDTNQIRVKYIRTFNLEQRKLNPMRTIWTDFMVGIGVYDFFCWCWHIQDRLRNRY